MDLGTWLLIGLILILAAGLFFLKKQNPRRR